VDALWGERMHEAESKGGFVSFLLKKEDLPYSKWSVVYFKYAETFLNKTASSTRTVHVPCP
jgi:hypothetical protein